MTCVSDRFITAIIPGEFSIRDQFFPYELEPDDSGTFIHIEMTGEEGARMMPGESLVFPCIITTKVILWGFPLFNNKKGRASMHLKVVITEGIDGWYVATVPSLPGCISQGRTIEEAEENIKEAISLHLEPDEDMVTGRGSRVIEVII